MSDLLLQELEVQNFRSIRGRVYAPLDARVVLVHGENGAGKTSLLSAIELALTGKIQSLHRVDPNYSLQLLHRSAEEGYVVAKTLEAGQEQSYRALLNAEGARSLQALDDQRATFFSERTFLPQAHLGQLLQIYQDAEPSANSPLAKFVSELLGLDRLDALELGLKPLSDVRNIRRIVDGWSDVEHEQARIERILEEQRTAHSALSEEVRGLTDRLAEALSTLQIVGPVNVDQLDEIEASLRQLKDVEALQRLSDNQRRLASIRREVAQALISSQQQLSSEGAAGENPIEVFAQWNAENEERILALRNRVAVLLPQASLPSDLVEFGQTALQQLRVFRDQLLRRGTLARNDQQRLGTARGELDASQKQLVAIDAEINKMAVDAGSLSSALAELTAFISDDICPVCDRDFSEHSKVTLSAHVQTKIRTLSTSADRLLTLGRSRSASQVLVEKLQGEIASLEARAILPSDLANIDRQHALVTALTAELEAVATTLSEGARLRAAEVAYRRALAAQHSRTAAITAAHETLTQFAQSAGYPMPAADGGFEAAVARLDQLMGQQTEQLKTRVAARNECLEAIGLWRSMIVRSREIEARIAEYQASLSRTQAALRRGQKVREQGQKIRNAVDQVRSSIIRREFNDRLNRLWRDLFVRLAPSEPFVPAFRIPQSSTQRLQPKLITEHRDGGETGGTPGAMLSAGNLNTAAVSLFTALHLSVPNVLPWLILDDPVQSMDDVHIAHFAALLRTLSKEHGRQIFIAVHDRQLFEYLRLELSPAFVGDSLLTLEIVRGVRRDTQCVAQRFNFQEETALLSAA